MLSPLKRRDVRRRNLARTLKPSMCRTTAGSYVDRGHRWEENETFNLRLYIDLDLGRVGRTAVVQDDGWPNRTHPSCHRFNNMCCRHRPTDGRRSLLMRHTTVLLRGRASAPLSLSTPIFASPPRLLAIYTFVTDRLKEGRASVRYQTRCHPSASARRQRYIQLHSVMDLYMLMIQESMTQCTAASRLATTSSVLFTL